MSAILSGPHYVNHASRVFTQFYHVNFTVNQYVDVYLLRVVSSNIVP